MLSAVLKSPAAIAVSIGIMNAFVVIRHTYMEQHLQRMDIKEMRLRIERIEDALENNLGAINDLSEEMRQEIDNIYNAIGALSIKQQELPEQKPANPIGFDSPIYNK